MEEEKARLGMTEGEDAAGAPGDEMMMGHGEDAELAKALAMSLGQGDVMDVHSLFSLPKVGWS